MGNAYQITVCEHCDKPTDCTRSIMVHRAANFALAAALLSDRKNTFKMVAKQFCGHCGGHLPCGCGHPTPQS